VLKTTIGLAISAILLAILAWIQGGWSLVLKGTLIGGKMLLQVTPLLLLAFVTAGLISALISEDTVSRWLGPKSGLRGLMLGCLAGALIPGGPYVFFPLAATFLISGAQIGVVMAFIVSKSLWTISRLPLEVALLGPEITFIRYIATLAFPIIIGLGANVLFSSSAGKIREQIRELQGPDRVSGEPL